MAPLSVYLLRNFHFLVLFAAVWAVVWHRRQSGFGIKVWQHRALAEVDRASHALSECLKHLSCKMRTARATS